METSCQLFYRHWKWKMTDRARITLSCIIYTHFLKDIFVQTMDENNNNKNTERNSEDAHLRNSCAAFPMMVLRHKIKSYLRIFLCFLQHLNTEFNWIFGVCFDLMQVKRNCVYKIYWYKLIAGLVIITINWTSERGSCNVRTKRKKQRARERTIYRS